MVHTKKPVLVSRLPSHYGQKRKVARDNLAFQQAAVERA